MHNKLGKIPGRIVFDGEFKTPTDEEIFYEISNNLSKWKGYYPYASEATPKNMLELLGNPIIFRAYIDANHTGNVTNRHSCSGIIIYTNNSPVIWYSKRKNTVDYSSSGL